LVFLLQCVCFLLRVDSASGHQVFRFQFSPPPRFESHSFPILNFACFLRPLSNKNGRGHVLTGSLRVPPLPPIHPIFFPPRCGNTIPVLGRIVALHHNGLMARSPNVPPLPSFTPRGRLEILFFAFLPGVGPGGFFPTAGRFFFLTLPFCIFFSLPPLVPSLSVNLSASRGYANRGFFIPSTKRSLLKGLLLLDTPPENYQDQGRKTNPVPAFALASFVFPFPIFVWVFEPPFRVLTLDRGPNIRLHRGPGLCPFFFFPRCILRLPIFFSPFSTKGREREKENKFPRFIFLAFSSTFSLVALRLFPLHSFESSLSFLLYETPGGNGDNIPKSRFLFSFFCCSHSFVLVFLFPSLFTLRNPRPSTGGKLRMLSFTSCYSRSFPVPLHTPLSLFFFPLIPFCLLWRVICWSAWKRSVPRASAFFGTFECFHLPSLFSGELSILSVIFCQSDGRPGGRFSVVANHSFFFLNLPFFRVRWWLSPPFVPVFSGFGLTYGCGTP